MLEDHGFEGGLGDAVMESFMGWEAGALAVIKLAVRAMPGSGTPAEQMRAAGIDADAIVGAVKALLGRE